MESGVTKAINTDGIFASFRRAKTLLVQCSHRVELKMQHLPWHYSMNAIKLIKLDFRLYCLCNRCLKFLMKLYY